MLSGREFDHLRRRSLEDLNPERWAGVIKSIIREEADHTAASKRKPLTAIMRSFDNYAVCIKLKVDHRTANECGEIVAITPILKELQGLARENMQAGFSAVISELAKSTTAGWEEALETTLILVVLVGGPLRRPLVDEILTRQDLPSDLRIRLNNIRRSARP